MYLVADSLVATGTWSPGPPYICLPHIPPCHPMYWKVVWVGKTLNPLVGRYCKWFQCGSGSGSREPKQCGSWSSWSSWSDFKFTKVESLRTRNIKNILRDGEYVKNTKVAGNQVYLKIMVNFHALGSGSAFPILIRIQDWPNQCGSVLRIRIWDPGSEAFLTPGPGSGIRNRFYSGSRIQTPFFRA
jgi:hypothetical protein